LAREFRIEGVHRLLLYERVDHLEKPVVGWGNGVERFPAGLGELHRSRFDGGRKLDFSFEGGRNARAKASWHIGVDFERLLDRGDDRFWIIVLQEGAHY